MMSTLQSVLSLGFVLESEAASDNSDSTIGRAFGVEQAVAPLWQAYLGTLKI